MKKVGILFLLSLILVSTSVLAYNGYGYGISSPADILQNEWFVFGMIFVIFFAMIFFGLQKSFPDNKGIPAIIAAILSFFIAAALQKRFYFEAVGEWGVIIALIIAIFFIIKIARDSNLGFGGIMLGITLILLILVITNFDPSGIFPYQLFDIYYSLLIQEPNKWITLIIATIISFFVFYIEKRKPRRRARDYW